jgi:hypothetical protein
MDNLEKLATSQRKRKQKRTTICVGHHLFSLIVA